MVKFPVLVRILEKVFISYSILTLVLAIFHLEGVVFTVPVDMEVGHTTTPLFGYSSQQLLQLWDRKAFTTKRTLESLRKESICTRKKTKRGTTGGKNKTRQRSVNLNNLIQLTGKNTKIAKHVGLSIATLNTRSVTNKTFLIYDLIVENSLDLMLITETWLNDNDDVLLNQIIPEGYSYELQNRKGRGGGVMIIYKQTLDIKRVETTAKKTFEYIEVTFKSSNTLYRVVGVYRPPPSKQNKLTVNAFLSEFQDFIVDKTLLAGKVIIIGDFNFHVDDIQDRPAQKFLNLLESFNLQQHVEDPTHEAGHTLDLVISNTKDMTSLVKNVNVHQCGISDHYCVLFELNARKPVLVRKTIRYRKTKSIDVCALKQAITTSGLVNKVIESCTVSEKVTTFNSIMKGILDNQAPLIQRKIVIRPNTRWYNDKIRVAKKAQRSAEKVWRKTQLEIHRQIFVKARKIKNDLIVTAKKDHVKDTITNNKKNPKKLFQTLNGLLKHSKPGNNRPSCDSIETLTETFSEFFTDKITNIRKKLDEEGGVTEQDDGVTATTTLNSFRPASDDEIKDILKDLPNKTCSLDPVPTWIIIQCANELCPAITSIVNCSLTSSEMPCVLKSAVVKPLLKKAGSDKNDLKNYRPVSNLSFMSKVIEKVVAVRINEYIHNHGLIPKFQSAYRSCHSTETALLRVHNDIVHLVSKKKTVMLVLLDLSAAFDTIDNTILVKRLESYFGVRGSALEWLRSYMNDRSMSISLDNNYSKPVPVLFGVPQGSILGPLLYTMYTAPLGDIISQRSINFHMYADDTQIYVPLSETNNSLEKLEQCLKTIKKWMIRNKLKLNEEKTEVMLISSKNFRNKNNTTIKHINFDGKEISLPTCDVVRNLGFYFDRYFDMEAHVKKICQCCHFHLRNIGKIRNFIDNDTTHMLVHSFITSRLDYCNALLTGIPSYLINRLQKIQNKAARLVVRKGRDVESKEILKHLHWLPVQKRIDFKIACYTYKCLHDLAPSYLKELLEIYEPGRILRSSVSLVLKTRRASTCFEERAFSIAAPKIWNSLSSDTRNSKDFQSFKRNLKTEIFKTTF